jgi:hypothetical protein
LSSADKLKLINKKNKQSNISAVCWAFVKLCSL